MTTTRTMAAFCAVIVLAAFPCHASIEDFLSRAEETLYGKPEDNRGKPATSEIIDALKEALNLGTTAAIGKLSLPDGFLKNPEVKIMLPDAMKKTEGVLRAVGYGTHVDNFEQSMNRAAERAVPEASGIFVDAITAMTFEDAQKILKGKDNEATLYFKEKASGRLRELFKPMAHSAMSEVGVTRIFQDINTKLGMIPMADRLTFDLDEYVTEKTLEGLFHMIALEEQKIRRNPAARVTDLLKKVFSY